MGKAIRFHEKHIRAAGRTSMGVHSMRLAADDEIIGMAPIEDSAHLLSITQNGYGKRTDPMEYRQTARNGQGVLAMRLTDKTGPLAAQLMVKPDEDVLLITDDGTIIRTPVSDIRICGRNAQGVRLMRVAESSRIAAVSRVVAAEEWTETEGTSSETP